MMIAISAVISPQANGETSEIDIGETAQVVNSVYGTPEETKQARWWHAGLDIFHNETVVTAESSASRVIFKDNSQLSIGPTSWLKLDNFIYNPNQNAKAVSISLVRGVFRFVGGKLSKEDVKITTPAATIGVRGTAFTVYILQSGAEYISVESGVIYVACHQGVTQVVRAGQMTYIGSPQGSPSVPQQSVPIPAVAQMDALLR
ncbi:MAG TPA: FecR family protein [Stellaceae bacterium]|jgi:hypothetical protein|nr:FecR family protein [Stellaceae bacterium]